MLSVVCWGYKYLQAHFTDVSYTPTWVFALSVFAMAVVGQIVKQAEVKHPRFSLCSQPQLSTRSLWVLAGNNLIAMAKYTSDSHITTVEEVKAFFRHIVFDLDINFHPDDDFKDYVNSPTGERSMDDEQAELYNRLMEEAFEVCGDEDMVYEIGCDLLKERLQIK